MLTYACSASLVRLCYTLKGYGVELTNPEACLAVLVAGQRSQASLSARGAVNPLTATLLPACFTPRTEFHSVRIFTFGHPEFEYGVQLFSIKLADSTMLLFDRCTLRTMEGAPLESESQPEPGRQSKAAPRAPNVQRLATGDG